MMARRSTAAWSARRPEGFALDGYRFDPDLSSPEDLDLSVPSGRWTWVFSRPDPREAF